MKFEIKRKRRRKHLKKPIVQSDNNESQIMQNSTRYLEQECYIDNPSKEELETILNEMLGKCELYGDLAIWIDSSIHIYRQEVSYEEQYFAKVVLNKEKNKPPVSTEKEVRLLKESGEIHTESCLIDVVFWEQYRILIFRK